jgi:cell division protein FtsN
MIQKTIIILILGCTGGAGLFFGDVEIADNIAFFNSGDQPPVMKKKNLVKPKSFYSKRKPRVADFKYDQLSFVPVLNDSSLSTMMGLNGQVIKKINYSPPSARVSLPEKKIRKKIPAPVAPVKTEKEVLKNTLSTTASEVPKKIKKVDRRETAKSVSQILKKFPILFAGGDTGTDKILAASTPVLAKSTEPLEKIENPISEKVSFVVQVSSFRTMQRAEVLRDALGKKGYDSFIGKTELSDNKGTWYRVNIGRYLDHADAKMAATKYHRKESRKAMVRRKSG